MAAPQPAAPLPSYSYAQKTQKSPVSEKQPTNNDGGNSSPTANGSPDSPMQQINLASPPPMPSNLRNADFF